MWETATGRNVLCLKGHTDGVTSIAFAPDGRRVLSGSRDSTARIWDVTDLAHRRGPEQQLSPSQRAALWRQLADTDAAVAHRAVWRLVAVPRQAVRLLQEELIPVKRVTAEDLALLVGQLDHGRFRARQKAFEQLVRLGAAAVPELSRRLADKPSLEMRRRIENLLDKLDPLELPPHRLREVRALTVLEQIGTADARQVLRFLADGAPGTWLTGAARASLQRLTRTPMK